MFFHVESAAGEALLDAEARMPAVEGEEGATTMFAARPPQPDEVANRVSVLHSAYEGSAAGSLEVPVIASGEAEMERVTVVQDTYRAFERTIAPGLREYWGGTVRLAVTAMGVRASASLSLPAISAKVQLEGFKASYRFDVLGLADVAPLADHLPTVGEFNTAAYASLLQSSETCAKLLMTAELRPVRLFADVDFDQAERATWSYLHALEFIRDNGTATRLPSRPENKVGMADWAVNAVYAEALRQENPKAWARDKFEKLTSTFMPS